MTKKHLFMGASAVILLIFVIATINWIGIQQNKLNLLQIDIYNLKNELNGTIETELDEVKQQILAELTRQNSTVFDASYTVTDYNKADNLAYVTVCFAMKEYNLSDPVTVVFTRAGDTQSVPATSSNGIFTAKVALKIDDKNNPPYKYSVSYRMGTDQVSSGQVIDICPGDDLYGRVGSKAADITDAEFNKNTGKEKIVVQTAFQNYFGSNEKLKFVSCKLYITFDGNVIKTVDLMDKVRLQDGYQLLDTGENLEFYFDANSLRGNKDTIPQTLYGAYVISVDGYGFEYR